MQLVSTLVDEELNETRQHTHNCKHFGNGEKIIEPRMQAAAGRAFKNGAKREVKMGAI